MSVQRRLRYVDPRARRGPVYRGYASLASSRVATRLSKQAIWSAIVWKIGPVLLRVISGALGTGLLLPTGLLQTRGACTGQVRRNAVIYSTTGKSRVTIVALQADRPGNPSWFYNARANPDVLLGDQPFQTQIVEDETIRARLWKLADRGVPASPPTATAPPAQATRSRSSSSSHARQSRHAHGHSGRSPG